MWLNSICNCSFYMDKIILWDGTQKQSNGYSFYNRKKVVVSNFALNVRVYKDVAKANEPFFETRRSNALVLAAFLRDCTQKKSQTKKVCDDVERETGLKPATFALARRRSINWATPACILNHVQLVYYNKKSI